MPVSKLYVKDMSDSQLNEWAAKAQDWEIHIYRDGKRIGIDTGFCDGSVEYNPIKYSQQAMDLQVAFKLHVIPLDYDNNGKVDSWMAYQVMHHPEYEGSTPNKAIVRAVIASVYGEFVEDL